MCMYRTRHRRALRFVSMLIVMAMLLAPTASCANCCCVLTKLGDAAGFSVDSCCDQQAVRSCCVSRATKATPVRNACCNVSPGSHLADAKTVHSAPTKCECEQSCCDGADFLILATLVDKDSSQFVQHLDAASSFSVAYDFSLTRSELGKSHSFPFLSAPHRCASLCRWLN